MKKIISCILILTLALGLLAACSGGSEDGTTTGAPVDAASEVLLPMGLEFGMTYEEFTAKLAENGFTFASWETPTDHGSDTGFDSPFLLLSGTDDLPLDCTFLHSPSLSAAWGADSSMGLIFSFDENRALYEVSCNIWLMKDADTVRSEIESFLDGFFPPNSRKSRIEYGWDYESPANHAMLFSMSFISYVFETKAGVKLSERETEPSEDEIRRAVAEVIDSTPQYAEWSAVSIGKLIARIFDDYTLEVEPVGGSVYNATISGTYVPIADMPNYLLQGAITYRVDIEARTCVVVNDPDNINGILTSYVFN